MELNGSTVIAQPKEKVWAALNDEVTLQQCITGCEAMQRIDENSLSARLSIKLGPVRAKFNGQVSMSNIRPLEGYTLTFEGSGGAAGFAKGSSNVELTTVETGTQVSYTANASVGGKLGQIGGRMIDAAAKGMADDFFAAFGKTLEKNQELATQNDSQRFAEKANFGDSKTLHQAATSSADSLDSRTVKTANDTAATASNLLTPDNRMFWFCAGIACGTALLLIGKHFL